MGAPRRRSGALGVPTEPPRGVRGAAPSEEGVRLARRKEGAARQAVTDEATPPLGAGVALLVERHQLRGTDMGVALGRAQSGVPE